MKKILLILAILLFAVQAWGLTYYDSSADTTTSYETIAAMMTAETMADDDVIDLEDATFYETITVNGSGSEDHPVIIQNGTVNAGIKIVTPLEWVTDTTTYPGSTFYKCQVNPTRVIYGIWQYQNGNIVKDYFYRGGDPSDCENTDDFSYASGWVWILTDTKPAATETDCIIYGDQYNAILIPNYDYITIKNINTLCSSYGGQNYHGGIGVYGLTGDYNVGIKIEDCNSSHNSYKGIAGEYTDGLTITDCIVSYNARAGGINISTGSADIEITGCTSYYNGAYPDTSGSDRGGISIGGGTTWHTDALIENCTSHHNGIYDGGYVDGGIHIFNNQNSTIRNCKSYANGGPGIMINGSKSFEADGENIITGNVVYGNGLQTTTSYKGGIVSFWPSEIINNTVFNNLTGTTSTGYSHSGIFISMGAGDFPCIIENNIIFNNAVTEGSRYELYVGSTIQETYIGYNCIYNTILSDIVYISGAKTWAEYVTYGVNNSINSNPLLVQTWKLKEDSPALGTGVDITDINDGGELDMAGNAARVGDINIGAYYGYGMVGGGGNNMSLEAFGISGGFNIGGQGIGLYSPGWREGSAPPSPNVTMNGEAVTMDGESVTMGAS